jgi:hypothetical protein
MIAVDKEGSITQVDKEEGFSFHPALRYAATVISYLFHPLFIPVYVGWFLIYVLEFFPDYTGMGKIKLMISMAVNYSLLPLVTLLLAKALGFVQSIYLKTQKDRIIPYVTSGIFYFWIWYVFRNQGFAPQVVMFALAIFLSSSAGLIANSFLKVSMHAISMGVLATYVLLLGFATYKNYGPYISAAFFIAGLVCTSRLILSNHSPKEIYVGLAIGILGQIIAAMFA